MMHMTFYWSREVTVLFSSWKTDSWLTYSLTLLACFLAGAFYQYVDHIRIRIRRAVKPNQTESVQDPLIPEQKSSAGNKWSVTRIASGVLFGISSGIGYLLMLAVMSFNGGVFLAIVFGLTVGYLVFRSDDGDDESAGGANSTCACA